MSTNDHDPSPLLHPSTQQRVRATRLGISLDWWAVIIALAAAALLRANVLPAIPWDPPKPSAAATAKPAAIPATTLPAASDKKVAQ